MTTGRDEDHRASVGLLVSVFLFPVWYVLLFLAGWRWLPPMVWIPLLVCGPVAGYVALRWMDRFERFGRETAGLWLALTGPGIRNRLAAWRRQISDRLERLART